MKRFAKSIYFFVLLLLLRANQLGAQTPATIVRTDSQASLTVGNARARPGETAYGEIAVPPGSDPSAPIPVAVVHGVRPGPVVALMAGGHGTEYTTIVALSQLISRIDPRRLTGSVIVVPLFNRASFEQMVPHINPVDGKGMYGLLPDSAGTQTPRVLAALVDQVIRPATVVIDLHGGDLDEDARSFSLWLRGGKPAQDSASWKLVDAFGMDHVEVQDIDGSDPANRRTVVGYAMLQGKTVFMAAVGRSGLVLADDLAAAQNGLLGILGSLGMIDHPPRPIAHPVWVTGRKRVAAGSPGIFYPSVARASYVNQGMKVGYTTDYLGRPTGDVLSPITGTVLYIRSVPSMSKGATLITVASVMSQVPPYLKPGH